MNGNNALLTDRASVLILAVAGFFLGGFFANAQNVQHLTITQPGGMPGLPVMTGIERVTNGVSVTWDGPSGYYQVYQKSNSLLAPWVALGKATNLVRYAVITKLYSNAFFRVSGPAPKYAGLKVCLTCHLSICQYVTNTPHASAFSNPAFKAAGGQTNSSCLPCHTVGYGLPTGFSFTNKNGVFSYATNLAGVQCENCHGPAANHAAATDDPTVTPRVEIAATVCGGCHTGPMQPTYEEWNTSGHAAVVPDALQTMSSSTNNISSCGRCHSGSVRLALINGQNPVALTNDLDVAITCAVCHDPHQTTNGYPAQLRNPVASTNNYFLTTSTNFASAYNPGINICAQCHNHRGAAWTATDRAPHHSLQYNFLLGSIGELPAGSATFNPGSHAGLPASAVYSLSGTFYLTNQCVSCHMQNDAPPATTQSHAFTFGNYNACLNCHPFDPDLLVQDVMVPAVSNRVYQLKYALDLWAATKAPAALQTNGAVAWEYTTPGGLIWQTNLSGTVTGWIQLDTVNFNGPNAAGQALIPDNIKRARFNLYLVLNDGSFGVHNPFFAIDLLDAAENWVTQELNN
jgi:hypothetical protein